MKREEARSLFPFFCRLFYIDLDSICFCTGFDCDRCLSFLSGFDLAFLCNRCDFLIRRCISYLLLTCNRCCCSCQFYGFSFFQGYRLSNLFLCHCICNRQLFGLNRGFLYFYFKACTFTTLKKYSDGSLFPCFSAFDHSIFHRYCFSVAGFPGNNFVSFAHCNLHFVGLFYFQRDSAFHAQ